jgi:predicted glycosyltransferase
MRFLFHCRNTTGLGHLIRGKNIANAIQQIDPDVEVIFTGNRESVAPRLIEFPYLPYLSSERMIALQPDVVIADTLFPNWNIPDGIRFVYVMRKIKADHLHKFLENPLAKRADFVLIPHPREECANEFPVWIKQKACWVGPIVREPDRQIQQFLREKYEIQENTTVITSTVGGGGRTDESSFFFGIVSALHKQLNKFFSHLRHFVVLGPYSQVSLLPRKAMTILRLEPELHNLIALSNLVIAEGGYNTVNEIRRAKVPAIFIPAVRKHDNQEERVRTLEAKGYCAVFMDRSIEATVDGILKLIGSDGRLNAMQINLQQDDFQTGNRLAAAKILELARSARI